MAKVRKNEFSFAFHSFLCIFAGNMRKVIGIGETILDIIFKNDQPIQAVPGGSTFNAIISLGRCGVSTAFISEVGDDHVGKNIKQFLVDNHVNADGVAVFPDTKSSVSLAFLDDSNNADYIFYKDHPHDRLDFNCPEINRDDIILFGSYFAINPVIRTQVKGLLEYAKSQGAILYYDLNYRASHQNEFVKLTPNILENLELADIVRGSDEDFEIMYHKSDADAVYRSEISFYTKKFIYTRGAKPVEVRAENGFGKSYPVMPVQAVSTIGAGDNFNAGFAYGLIKHNITSGDIEAGLSEQQWDCLMASAQAFAANCCKSINNSIDEEFAKSL